MTQINPMLKALDWTRDKGTGTLILNVDNFFVHILQCSVSALFVVLLFCMDLSMVSGFGYYIFQIFDDYAVTIPLLVIALFQCIAIGWVYGTDKYDYNYLRINITYFEPRFESKKFLVKMTQNLLPGIYWMFFDVSLVLKSLTKYFSPQKKSCIAENCIKIYKNCTWQIY